MYLATVREVYEGWARGDFTVGFDLFSPDAVLALDPGMPDGGQDFVGPEAIRGYMRGFLDAWDSLTIEAESFEDLGEKVRVKVKQSGIGRGSGVPSELGYFQLWTFQDGKVMRLDSLLES